MLARELHGLEPDEAFCAALETATGGNPLFVGAVLDAVARQGTSPTAEHAPRLLEMGALGVARAVGLRLARLPPEALGPLAASVLGDGTELRHAAALAGVEAGELGATAAALGRLDLLRREDPLEFFHPVVRSAVCETLDVVERDAAHRSAAELLLQAGAPPESAAGHLLRVAPRADSFVVSTLRQAAERSLAQGAAEVAVGYLTRVLDEQPDPATQAEVLVELGLAERRTNGPAAAEHLRAGLELLADPERRCAVAPELGRALWFTDRIADALAVFEQALDEVGRKGDPNLYELLLAELIGSAWWSPQTYPLAEATIGELELDALHGGLGSEILLATMAHYEYRQAPPRARGRARRALAPGNLLASGSIAFYYAVNVLPRSGLLDEALSILDQAVAQARRRGDIFNVAFMSMWRGKCQTDRGDLRAAVADLREALDLCVAHGMRVAWPHNIGFLAHALLEQGRRTKRRESSIRVTFQSSSRSTRRTSFTFASTAAVSAPRPEALSGSRGAAPGWRCRSAGPPRQSKRRALAELGRRRPPTSRPERRSACARRGGARARSTVGRPACHRRLSARAGSGQGGEAGIGLLGEAVELLAGSEARLEHARALVDLGQRSAARTRAEARERLREGVDLARTVGAFALAERANEEIAATGARPRKVLQTGLDALTASERRVAQLAADGMSNKEIAQTLFVTIKTVEMHLSHAYRKLEISSRAQLGKALATPAPSPASARLKSRRSQRTPRAAKNIGAWLGPPRLRVGQSGTQSRAMRTSGGDQAERDHTDPRRWWALALLCGAFLMVILDAAIVIVALPSIEADLSFSEQGLQWVISAYALTFAGLLLLGAARPTCSGAGGCSSSASSSRSPRSSAGSPGRRRR